MSKLNTKKVLSILFSSLGVLILIITVFPMIGYFIYSRSNFPNLKSPSVKNENYIDRSIDSKRASEWFLDNLDSEDFELPDISFYTLSIPKLNIEKATTSIGGEDLSKSLIHYPGTALPGQIGNSVIFGHSVLPIFYDPKNYLSIFSKLSALLKGDKIVVDYDGVIYTYIVEDLFEVSPKDIQILEQNESDSYITLVTCTPPGDPRKPKRLIVRARIQTQNNAYADIGN